LFLMHAPVSQRLFYYFSCVAVGEKKYLVQDYSIECLWSGDYAVFAAYVIFMLVVFTFGLPLLVSVMLLSNRKALYNPKVHATMGFLYARFQKGSEFWEMHEVVRKCALMGLLIFLPPTSRAAVGILICVVCCCTLNFFQPHRNRLVLFVSQMSFLMSTFKYVCAVFLRLNELKPEDAAVMGGIMVMLDVVFMLGSVVAVVLIVVLLRASVTTLQEKETLVVDENDGGGARIDSRVKVVPTSQEVTQTLKKQIAALKWQKNIRQTLVNNIPKNQASKLGRVKSTRTRKVEEIEQNHQNHRNMAVQNIKDQQVQRRSSLQLRVQARNQKRHVKETAASKEVKKDATGASVQQTVITEDGATARKCLCKIGVKKTWKVVSKNIQQNKEKQPMLNRAIVVNLFKKLKMVEPDAFLSRQFGGHIEAHVFMAWVFEAEIQTGKIERQQVEDAINGTCTK
jgi:hypothetical protein